MNGGYGEVIDQGSLAMKGQTSQVETVLVEAQRDLDSAQFHLPFICNPIRHFVVAPALGIASFVLPEVVKALPMLDDITAKALEIPFGFSRTVYMQLHSEQADAQWKTYRDAVEAFDELVKEPKKKSDRQILAEKASDHTAKGFLISATVEFLSEPKSNLQKWLQYTRNLNAYIEAAGIDDEIHRAFGSQRLALNGRIIGNIQSVVDNTNIRRIETAIPGATFDICPKVVAK